MKLLLRNVAFLCSAVFILQTTQAQILLGTGGYTQDFLNYSGNSGGEPSGWSVSCANFRGQGDGSSNSGGAWSYGPSGNSDRSLGYLGSGTSANYTATVSFVNNTGAVITGLNIAYDFEQWRTAGGNTNGFNVTASGIGASVSGLSQTSFNSTPNLPYIVNKSIALTNLSIAPGAVFSLTWASSDGAGNDNGKSIDNFSIMPVIVVPGCSPSSTPDLVFNGIAETCAGNTVNLTTLSITDNNNTTGSFSYYSNPSATVVVPNPSAVANSGIYYLVKTTSSGNCTDTIAIPVTIHPLPDATISGQNIVCENSSVISLSSVTPGGTWSGTGIVNPSSGDFDPSVSGSGTFPVIYDITVNNCQASDTFFVTVNPMPDATISGQNIVCENSSVISLSSVTPGGTWSGTGIVNPSSGDFDPVVSGNGTFQVIYDITVNNCQASDTFFVTVDPTPDATISGQNIVCENSSVISLSSVTPGGTWSGAGIVNPSSGDFDPSFSGSGTFPVIYDITVNNCQASDTFFVTVNPMPDATISGQNIVCENAPVISLSSLTPGGTWSGAGIVNPSSGDFDPSVSGSGTFPVIYDITVNNCQASDTFFITVNPMPDAQIITPDTLVCESNSVFPILTVNAGGVFSGPGIVNPASGNFDIVMAGQGTHQVMYHILQNGCADSDVVQVVVMPTPDATILSHDTTICSGNGLLTLTALNNGGFWSGPGITNSTLGLFDPLSGLLGLNTIVYQLTSGMCTHKDTIYIQVDASPVINIPFPGNLCTGGAPVQFAANPSGGQWSGNFINSSGIFLPAQSGAGTFPVVYAVTQNGCTSRDTLHVVVNQAPQVSFSIPDSVCLNTPPFMLQVQPSGGSWTGNGVNTNGMFSPQSAGLGLHTFQYLVSNGSCTTSATRPVFVENPPVAGFTFTTNGLDVDFYGALSVNSTFSWDYGDGTQGTGQNSEHFYQGAGTYTVILYVTNFCGVDTFQRIVTVGNSAIETYEENIFKIWPVPAADILNIHCENDAPFMATIWDINGKQVQSFAVVKSAIADIATLAPGMYIIRMESDGITGITRFIKR